MHILFRRCVFVAGLLTGLTPLVQAAPKPPAPAASVAFRRLAVLGRGVNLSGWFGGWGDLSAEHIATWTTPADLQFIHSIGLQDVRLGVDPAQFAIGAFDSPASMAALARLDHSIDDILAAGLSVQLTVFPRSDFKHALTTTKGEEDYLALWKFLAAHYASRDPERVFYDLLNEPEVDDLARWDKIQADVVAVIRSVDTKHTLIATGAKYDGLDELLQVKLVNDTNVIYTFHFYEPFPFTHQGATWSTPALVHLHDVPYPGAPEKLGPMIAGMSDPEAAAMLTNYASEGWDETVMRRRLTLARAWADKNHVPIIANEFGAFRDTIPVEARARFVHDARTIFESLHIPWAMWDYRGNFGMVVHGVDGAITPDAPIVEALGLSLPAPLAVPPIPPASAVTQP